MKISQAYLEEQKRLHADPRGYGGRGSKWCDTILELTATTAVETILDYGAGQGTLGEALRNQGFFVTDFDPAVERFRRLSPGPYDLVTCTDVLEHVEEQFVDAVIAELASLAELVFVVISLVPTEKTLSDGRQAHITLRPAAWWIKAFERAGKDRVEILPAKKPEKELVALFGVSA